MAGMELAPFRPWDDFFPGVDRFSRPDVSDLSKWNNRVISNLLYYQTNYFAAAIVVILIVGYVNVLNILIMYMYWCIHPSICYQNVVQSAVCVYYL